MTSLSFPGQNPVNLAVASGRAEMGMADSPVADYQVKQSEGGQFKLIGKELRSRALRHRDPEDDRHDHSRCSAALKAADRRRHVRERSSPSGASQSGAITDPKINGAIG